MISIFPAPSPNSHLTGQYPDISLVCGDGLLFNETGPWDSIFAHGMPKNTANFRWETVGYCAITSTVMVQAACFESSFLRNPVREGGRIGSCG